ncbi:MAG: hypothetical protein ACLP50_05410 [Solirubrobacteraceae bacterium]
MGDPRMTEHLGGPESPDKLRERQGRSERIEGGDRMHAFPNVDNAPSNAIYRRLGFELLEACVLEFPKRHVMTCNDWRLDLRAQLRQALKGVWVIVVAA